MEKKVIEFFNEWDERWKKGEVQPLSRDEIWAIERFATWLKAKAQDEAKKAEKNKERLCDD